MRRRRYRIRTLAQRPISFAVFLQVALAYGRGRRSYSARQCITGIACSGTIAGDKAIVAVLVDVQFLCVNREAGQIT